MIISLH